MLNCLYVRKLPVYSLTLIFILLNGCATRFQNNMEIPEQRVFQRQPESRDPLLDEMEARENNIHQENRGPEVSGNYFDTDIRAILMELSSTTGINLIPDQTVQGMLTLSFTDLNLEEVLDMILYPGGWTYKQENGYYLIGSADPKNPASARLMDTECIVTNSAAGEVKKGIPLMYQPYVSVSDEAGHRLTISAPKNILWKIKEAVGTVDKAKKLIAVNVVVVELTSTAGMAVGLDWGDSIMSINSSAGISSESGAVPNLTGAIRADLSLTLLAMGKSGNVDIRANPKIVAVDGETAIVEIMTNRYMPIVDNSENLASTDVKIISSGISLTILPRITRDREILLQVEPVVSDQGDAVGSGGLPVINTRRARTTVKLRNEETFMLGGLLEENNRTEIYNAGFTKNKVNRELIIFLTPEIL